MDRTEQNFQAFTNAMAEGLKDIEKERQKKILRLSSDVLQNAINTILVNFRFLDAGIGRLKPIPAEIESIMVDGEYIYYSPMFVLKSYKKAKELLPRQVMHMLLHCIYRHFYSDKLLDNRLWNLACDIAVENCINDLNAKSIDTAVRQEQEKVVNELKKHCKYITAEVLYRYLLDAKFSDKKLEQLSQLFQLDDHSIWYEPLIVVGTVSMASRGGQAEFGGRSDISQAQLSTKQILAEDWEFVSKQLQMDMETFSKQRGDTAGNMMQNLREVNREKYDYSSFLKKFAVMGEAMKINDDEFDYIFYTYGMKLFGRMPLIEPLEYKEVKRIREFVIAIDTSGSTSGKLVQKFLQKTYNILCQTESFFSKINLHIIQCDADIQEDVRITSSKEFDEYLKKMKIRGLGGTDFRPVFEHVDRMIQNHEFTNLKGLIYFTDGFGVFPKRQPDYHTAFVYIDEGYENPHVPVWAIKLVLKPEEI